MSTHIHVCTHTHTQNDFSIQSVSKVPSLTTTWRKLKAPDLYHPRHVFLLSRLLDFSFFVYLVTGIGVFGSSNRGRKLNLSLPFHLFVLCT